MAEKLQHRVSCTTLRSLLKQAGLSWKKSKKVLAKANPTQRAEFVARFQDWFGQLYQGKVRLIYVDEAHLHQDMELGYRWSTVGEPDWVPSTSPLSKIGLTGMGLMILAMVNVSSGIKVLATVTTPLIFCNTWLMGWGFLADIVKPLLCANKRPPWAFSLIQLPSYSPDLNPIEGLWKWMREDLTQHHCYKYLYQLEHACLAFIERINLDPETIISRLWPKFELDPDYEKVLFSF